jgi:SAM-dependent methyltransferase
VNSDLKVGLKRLSRQSRDICLRSERLYRLWLEKVERVSLEPGMLDIHSFNRTLRSKKEWEEALNDSHRLGLPIHPTAEKNWDTRIIVGGLLANTDDGGLILDAGAESYSKILSTLYLYGRRDLLGINLSFRRPFRRGPIRFRFGDITATGLPPNSVAGVGCQSVIEHGVPLDDFLMEVARILRPGGVVIASTDYYPEPIATQGLLAYGVPVKIFNRGEIEDLIQRAAHHGLILMEQPELECQQTPVFWERLNLRYTFICLAFRKAA